MSIESIEARLAEAEKMASLVKLDPAGVRLLLNVARAARELSAAQQGAEQPDDTFHCDECADKAFDALYDAWARMRPALDALEAGK